MRVGPLGRCDGGWSGYFGVLVLILAFLATPSSSEAQGAARISRIGILAAESGSAEIDGLQAGLRELGYVEGRNLTIEWRFAEGIADRLPGFASELVTLKVDAIIAYRGLAAFAAKKATETIPIVFMTISEPVRLGLVQTLSRPGGNVTGFTQIDAELSGKRLDLLKEMLPGLKSVVLVLGTEAAAGAMHVEESQIAAQRLGLDVRVLKVSHPDDLPGAFSAVTKDTGAVCILPSLLLLTHRTRILELATKARVPIAAFQSEFVKSGALMSYGANHFDIGLRAATYVDKILKGAKPTDLPVQQPIKFEFVVNLKTAQELGLTIPPTLLFQADEVIR
jgi:putative tryptophan/tyrosine transport system substrate-binding protein